MPTLILEETQAEVKRPADFEAFWAGVKAELNAVPADWERLLGARRRRMILMLPLSERLKR